MFDSLSLLALVDGKCMAQNAEDDTIGIFAIHLRCEPCDADAVDLAHYVYFL